MLEILELSPGELVHLGDSFKYSITEGAAWDEAAAELWRCSMTLEFPGLTSPQWTDPILQGQKSPPFWLSCHNVLLNELVIHPGTRVFRIYTAPSTGTDESLGTLGIHAIKRMVWTLVWMSPEKGMVSPCCWVSFWVKCGNCLPGMCCWEVWVSQGSYSAWKTQSALDSKHWYLLFLFSPAGLSCFVLDMGWVWAGYRFVGAPHSYPKPTESMLFCCLLEGRTVSE